MNSEIKVRIEKLKSVSRNIALICFSLRTKFEVIRPLLFNKDFLKQFETPHQFIGVQTLRNCVTSDIINGLVGISQDTCDKAASFLNVEKCLTDDRIVKFLLREFLDRPEVNLRFLNDENPELQNAIAEIIKAKKGEKLADCFGKKLFLIKTEIKKIKFEKRLKTLRDKSIAHFEIILKNGKHQLHECKGLNFKWIDLEKYLIKTERISLSIEEIVNKTNYPKDDFIKEYKKISSDFWRIKNA